jgi:hypothetical protein
MMNESRKKPRVKNLRHSILHTDPTISALFLLFWPNLLHFHCVLRASPLVQSSCQIGGLFKLMHLSEGRHRGVAFLVGSD